MAGEAVRCGAAGGLALPRHDHADQNRGAFVLGFSGAPVMQAVAARSGALPDRAPWRGALLNGGKIRNGFENLVCLAVSRRR